jgi:hypothetical protein
VRKLAIAGVLSALLGVGTATAASLSPGSPARPQGVRLDVSLAWQGRTPANQPQVTKLDFWFPQGTQYNGARYPKCSEHVLSSVGPKGCPKGSIMGSGRGTAFADTVVTHPAITVVNGGAGAVYFFTTLNNPARVQTPVVGRITRLHGGPFAYHLSATIPLALQFVAGISVKLTALHISAGKGTWLATTAAPSGVKVMTTFGDGATDTDEVLVQNV